RAPPGPLDAAPGRGSPGRARAPPRPRALGRPGGGGAARRVRADVPDRRPALRARAHPGRRSRPDLGTAFSVVRWRHSTSEEVRLPAVTRILAPIDFSPSSRAALDYAVFLAGKHGAELEVLHVAEPPGYVGPDALALLPVGTAQPGWDQTRADVQREV